MGDEVHRQKVRELLEEFQNLKRTAGGLIYIITTPEGKRLNKQIGDIKYLYENPSLRSIDQTHVGILSVVVPKVRKDIEILCEERGLQ